MHRDIEFNGIVDMIIIIVIAIVNVIVNELNLETSEDSNP